MPLDRPAARQRLQQFDFAGLFTQELGWDWHTATAPVAIASQDFTLQAIAHKRGFVVWHCPPAPGGELPDSALRRRIEREATKAAHEHLVIFSDAAKTLQVWQWVRREPGKPLRVRETMWSKGQSGEVVLQKLDPLFVSLDDEETLTLLDVTGRAGGNVDERVTKRFYEEFRKQHAAFVKFITGIPNQGDHEWYASVMLNRLMFLYFIQRKGFLDGDRDYLRNRLNRVKNEQGEDKFYRFYRHFLVELFHKGLGSAKRDAAIVKLVGRVPYLNGGIFDVHKLERPKAEGGYGKEIQIPDKAFEAVFDYFDRYQWHLDERPLRADNEINPDVLGYIFEKYINQKQMGAYYTKEDITEYIGKNTIIPFLFDAVRGKVKAAFEGDSSVWSLLRQDPDRYIYPAVRHGLSWDYQPGHPEQGEPLARERPLPPEIAAGVDTAKPNLLERRKPWNKPAPATHGLPTEIWRETIARRQRCAEVRQKLAAGEIHDIADFITLNLDVRRFTLDVIARCDSPELLAAFWHTLAGRPARKSNDRSQPPLTILDPTCGSGAFLFAALNILEPLYEACLDRMEGLLADARSMGTKIHPDSHLAEFQSLLQKVEKHPNERYFIFKTIILNNLYGVDLMEEAVEICKLRLFLKLAAQVEPDDSDANLGIEPLPDIDFNIRAGNTLVGYATRKELESVADYDNLLLKAEVKQVLEVTDAAASLYDTFVQSQLEGENTADFKRQLGDKFKSSREKCDYFLAEGYFGEMPNAKKFADWKRTHQPFHWFVEFPGILKSGGFDAIIGNPPYIELKEIAAYGLTKYSCKEAGNLYAVVIERCAALGKSSGRQGFIVPVSSVSTDRYESLQQLLVSREDWFSSFDDRPSRLFDGLEHIRLTIHILGRPAEQPILFSTRYNKWSAEEREFLFANLQFTRCTKSLVERTLPKLSAALETSIIAKALAQRAQMCRFFTKTGGHEVFYSRKVGYFLQVLDFAPRVLNGKGQLRPPSEFKTMVFANSDHALLALCCLNASFFYWIITVFSDCRHVNKREVDAFPIDLIALEKGPHRDALVKLAQRLMSNLKIHSEERVMRFKHDVLTVQCIYPKASKPILDEIDTVLAAHYGLTAEELDFIVNYDIKYRLGRGDKEEEE
jgi:hypothetical protein